MNNNLTAREIEVIKMASEGLGYKEIASELNITLGTMKNHAVNIFDKLKVYNMTHAVVKAIKHGLISVDNGLPELREYFERKYPNLLPEATITALEKVIELNNLRISVDCSPAASSGESLHVGQPGIAGPGCPNYLFEREK